MHGAIKAGLERGKKEFRFPAGAPLPFIGSVYTGARHRVISLFLSTERECKGVEPLSRHRLAFAPPFVFIRDSRGTLTATCQYVGLLGTRFVSFLPLILRGTATEHRGLPKLLGDRSAGKAPGKAAGRAVPRKETHRENGTRVTRRASHDYVTFSRASATCICYLGWG